MKPYMFLLFISFSSCTKPDPNFCEVDYHIYFKKNDTQLCLKSNEVILDHYNTDSVRVFIINTFGTDRDKIKYYFDDDSCMFLFPNIFSPEAKFTIGDGTKNQDTLSFVKNAKNVKYYLNGQFQYEVKDACRKKIVKCIIEI